MKKQPQEQPMRHGDLHDPKLPVIHGNSSGSQSLQQIHPAPIPQLPVEGSGQTF